MTLEEYLRGKTYPGRILVAGETVSGTPVLIYAVMGRSAKSQNRILKLNDDKLTTALYSPKLEGDDLIIYSAKENIGRRLLLGNGNHVSTIAEKLRAGKTLSESLFDVFPEPDEPNYTPRITLLYYFDSNSYDMAIVKKNRLGIDRFVWHYKGIGGMGHIIHTYIDNGNPLLSFDSDPVLVRLGNEVVNGVWTSLNRDNRVAMYAKIGKEERVINQRKNDENT